MRSNVQTHAGAGVYLKGQLGEWAPRQPQWQHWGELWLTHDDSVVCAEVLDATAVDEDEWCATARVVEVDVVECIVKDVWRVGWLI